MRVQEDTKIPKIEYINKVKIKKEMRKVLLYRLIQFPKVKKKSNKALNIIGMFINTQ